MNNREKYLKAPSVVEIQSFVNELGVTIAQFERFYYMPKRTIYLVMYGERDLPHKYWHIIYEKILPTYGLGYLKKEKQAKNKAYTKRYTVKTSKDKAGRLSSL